MTALKATLSRPWLWAALAMTLLKWWLTRGQSVFAIGQANHDDRLFLELAASIARGEWLGSYNQMTLAKGPFYSIFVAAAFWLGLPLMLAQQAVYAGACAIFVQACRPAIRSAAAIFAIYAFLLWNPMSFEASSLGRILRQQINPAQLLMIFAGFAALYIRRKDGLKKHWGWAAVLGLSFGSFWLTREDAIWLLPGITLLAGIHLIASWRESRNQFGRALKGLGLAATFAALPVAAVCCLNFHYYQWFGTVEFRAKPFRDAYGAILRVRVGPELPFVPSSRQAREAIYKLSPSFAELRPFLEGDIGRGWAEASANVTRIPAAERQIGSGWIMWALRDAVNAAGHTPNAREALDFYQRIADEINRACDAGLIPAGPFQSGFMPRLHEGQLRQIGNTFIEFTDFVVRFSRFSAHTPQSSGPEESLLLFRDLTREKISPVDGQLSDLGPNQITADEKKVRILHSIGKMLRPALLVLFILAQGVFIARLIQSVLIRSTTYPQWLATAAWGSGILAITVQAMVQVTSFPVMAISSFAAAYPLVLLFIVAVFWDASLAWFGPKHARREFVVPTISTKPPTPSPVEVLPTSINAVLALAALLPLLIWKTDFRQLFWFGDDYYLLDQIAQMGFWSWTREVFAENFVPLFKLLWGGSVALFDGSYFAMLCLLWLTHALNTFFLGRLLTHAGFPIFAVIGTQAIFAISPTNLETLGWSVQWSAVLATTFLLAALLWHQSNFARTGGHGWRLLLPLFLLCAASACSFSRGVLTGGVLALAVLMPSVAEGNWRAAIRRLPSILPPLIPAIVIAWVISRFSSGNHQQMAGHWQAAMEFGASYFLFNPLPNLLGVDAQSTLMIIGLAVVKLCAIAYGIAATRGRTRWLLLALLAYDLGNSILLGIGRHHTGFLASMSSRYQYSSLLATLPFLLLAIGALVEGLSKTSKIAFVGKSAVLAVSLALLVAVWPGRLAEFTAWRGHSLRALIAAPATSDPSVRTPALEYMHIERAKALARTFNLH